jgi:hypothetical protein
MLTDDHVHVSASGIAVLLADAVLRRRRSQPFGVEVEPALVEAEVVAFDTQELPDGALAAVGGDHVAGTHPLVLPRRFPWDEGQFDAGGVLGQPGDRPALPDLDAPHGADAAVDGVLDVGLVHRDVRWIPHRAVRRGGHVQQLLVASVDPQVLDRGRVAQRLLHVAGGLHRACGLVVDVGQPGQPVQRGPTLAHHDPVPRLAEQGGRDQAGRAVTDDRDIEDLVHAKHPFVPTTTDGGR